VARRSRRASRLTPTTAVGHRTRRSPHPAVDVPVDDESFLPVGNESRSVESLETELSRARNLDVDALADAIETIGFECTRCGACCKADADDPHTATVFPDEVRALQDDTARSTDADPATASAPARDATAEDVDATVDARTEAVEDAEPERYDWRDVARPMPYGLDDAPDGSPEGETFEWALATDDCGDCTFYEESADGTGACSVHDDRPLICETYPFSLGRDEADHRDHDDTDHRDHDDDAHERSDGEAIGTTEPMGGVVDRAGVVRAHECEGLGRDISRADAEALAAALKERAIRELEEAIGVRDNYEPTERDGVVVHDSEGQKHPDGTVLDDVE
jgi:Fe-S-cluster containining protein